MDIQAQGANYRIAIDGSGIAWCVVWKRPDLSRAEGAGCARALVSDFAALASRPEAEVSGLVLDLARAPEVWGPNTHQALGEAFAIWEASGRPLAVVAGPEPIQKVTIRALLRSFAPTTGTLVASTTEARAAMARAAEREVAERP